MKAIRSISAVVLAVLVLLSSTSFMVGMHLCQGEIQNVALFSKADGCEMEQRLPPCHRHEKAPCCDDETIINSADDFKASVTYDQPAAQNSTFIARPFVLISELIPATSVARLKYYNYDPPLRSHDLTVEHQVFLI